MLFLSRRPRRADARGQAMAEFALILPIALLILFGIIQFGFLFASQIGMVNALRETARYASTSQVTDLTTANSTGGIVCDYLLGRNGSAGVGALNKMPGYESAFAGPASVSYASYQDPHAGAATYSVKLTVYAEYRHMLLVPLVNVILDGLDGSSDARFRLGALESMRVENPLITTNPSLNHTVTC
jgi:Flp pilus assembly protein TadG